MLSYQAVKLVWPPPSPANRAPYTVNRLPLLVGGGYFLDVVEPIDDGAGQRVDPVHPTTWTRCVIFVCKSQFVGQPRRVPPGENDQLWRSRRRTGRLFHGPQIRMGSRLGLRDRDRRRNVDGDVRHVPTVDLVGLARFVEVNDDFAAHHGQSAARLLKSMMIEPE